MAEVLLVVAKRGFQDVEYADTRSVLESAGHDCVVASSEPGLCKGQFGAEAVADLTLLDVREDFDAFDAFVFIGGPGAALLKNNPDAVAIAAGAFANEKVVAAICIAPVVLAKAGILKGKRATVWDGDGKQSEFLEAHGAAYAGDPVIVDGKIVTANGPPAAKEFGKAISSLLK